MSVITCVRPRRKPPLLYSGIPLREGPAQRLDRVGDPLEVVLLLGLNRTDVASSRVIVLVAPLEFEGVEFELGVQTVDVLGGVGWEATEGVDEAHELGDVVFRHVT